MLSANQFNNYLIHIGQIKESHALVDIHVHPFEVIYNGLTYKKNLHHDGVYSSRDANYDPPAIKKEGRAPTNLQASCQRLISEDARQKCLMLTMRQLYQHTGPRVFADHMALSGIDRVLLLPVSGPGISIDDQMEMMTGMFGLDWRFNFGYSVPNAIGICDIAAVVNEAVIKYGIKAVKIHPAITGIDLQKTQDLERVEKILLACRDNDLSVIVHGGRSLDVRTSETIDFGELTRLELVNWSLAENPVIIAHAGIYGYAEEMTELVVKVLRRILDKHDNLMIDLSGVPHSKMCRLLRMISTDRIVFGSDALYYKQWKCLVYLYHALRETFSNADNKFIEIASKNAQKILKEDLSACINR